MLLPFTFNATARGLITLYASALLAGMWSMMVPAVPVMATAFAVSPGTAAQTITALALGRFAGMVVIPIVPSKRSEVAFG